MNRKIKFKVWDNANKIWFNSDNVVLTTEGKAFHKYLHYDLSCLEIVFFTGLRDKNGVEIYEGDIMRMNIKVGNDKMVICSDSIISFSNGSFWWTSKHWGMADCCWHFYNEQDREVIGNIYENLESAEVTND
jgi:uncharacterized phage protein (TIGR01671 family)